MSDQKIEESRFPAPLRGQFLFALLFVAISLLLLSQIGEQTKWVKKTNFAAQPRFWPMVGLSMMVIFGGLHLWNLPRWRLEKADWREGLKWFLVFEYAGWFLIYVVVVPVIGYLPATLLFMPFLMFRMGYRRRSTIFYAVAFGFVTVILFKSLLSVKIPGGLIYEFFPNALRNFLILNF